jgi:hypothetical protein
VNTRRKEAMQQEAFLEFSELPMIWVMSKHQILPFIVSQKPTVQQDIVSPYQHVF